MYEGYVISTFCNWSFRKQNSNQTYNFVRVVTRSVAYT